MVEEESSPFYRETKGYYNPQVKSPITTQFKSENNFVEKGVPFLQEVKENPDARRIAKDNGVYVGNPIWHEFLIIVFILVIIGGIVMGGWGIYNDKFKTEVAVNMTCPDIKIPECPVIEIPKCPSQVCDVTCPEFPDSIDVIIKNQTG